MKLVLIGNLQRKFDFLSQLKGLEYLSTNKFLHFAEVQIWPLLWDEVVPQEANVFLYLDADCDLKESFERQRDTNKCIGVDFYLGTVTPIACLKEVKELKAFYDGANVEAMKKLVLVLAANAKDDTCALHFSSLPKELAFEIGGSLWASTNGIGFFTIPKERTTQKVDMRFAPTGLSTF